MNIRRLILRADSPAKPSPTSILQNKTLPTTPAALHHLGAPLFDSTFNRRTPASPLDRNGCPIHRLRPPGRLARCMLCSDTLHPPRLPANLPSSPWPHLSLPLVALTSTPRRASPRSPRHPRPTRSRRTRRSSFSMFDNGITTEIALLS